MKRAVLAIVTTVTSLILLLSFKTHGPSAVATPAVAVRGTTNTNSSSDTSSTPNAAKTTAKSSSRSKTYTGSAAQTRYGPVQVQITVRNGRVVSAGAVEYPMNDPRDAQINAYAIPALNSEATSAGSASIDMISGATYTSQGYLSSLQSALDQAGL